MITIISRLRTISFYHGLKSGKAMLRGGCWGFISVCLVNFMNNLDSFGSLLFLSVGYLNMAKDFRLKENL
jgi:hypothetical protein